MSLLRGMLSIHLNSGWVAVATDHVLESGDANIHAQVLDSLSRPCPATTSHRLMEKPAACAAWCKVSGLVAPNSPIVAISPLFFGAFEGCNEQTLSAQCISYERQHCGQICEGHMGE